MNFLLNVLWIIFGGLEMAVGWLVAAFFFAISIVGIPWARAAFNLAIFHLWPFGREIVDREDVTGREDLGTGGLGLLGNIIWFVLADWWLAWRWRQLERWSSTRMSPCTDVTRQ